jgi:hypothetical protein
MARKHMNCSNHPMNNAIGICPSCNRAICEICSMKVMNIPHCKDCAEWIFYNVMKSSRSLFSVPIPKGQPIRKYFVIGGIGALTMVVGALLIGIFFMANFSFFGSDNSGFYWLLFAGTGLLAGGLIVTGVGFFGFYRNYGSFMGLITFIFADITSFIFISFTIFSISGPYGYFIGPEYIGAAVIVGICLVLMGVSLLLIKNYTMVRNLTLATGIFTLVVAALFCSVFTAMFFGIAWFTLVAAGILMAVVFFLAKLPPRYSRAPQLQAPIIKLKIGSTP